MTHKNSAPRRLRMTPLAAGLALVLAAGGTGFPLGADAAAPGHGAKSAQGALTQRRGELIRGLYQARAAADREQASVLLGELAQVRRGIREQALAAPQTTGPYKQLQHHVAAASSDPMRLMLKLHESTVSRAGKLRAAVDAVGAKARDSARPKAILPVINCNDSGAGSLRDVVAAAITGDTVDLTSLTCSTITLTSGEIGTAVDDLTIMGPGAGALTISGDNNGRIFGFSGYGTLVLQGLHLTQGYDTVGQGGAVAAYGSVVLRDTIISNSSTTYDTASGGAIWAGDDVSLHNSSIVDTTARSTGYGSGGGAIFAWGDVELDNSRITNAQVITHYGDFGAGGGAIFAFGGVTLSASTLENCRAEASDQATGGAVLNVFGPLVVNQSTVSGNTVRATVKFDYNVVPGDLGGGVAMAGGVYSYAGGVQLNHSVISGNVARGDELGVGGGGFAVSDYYGVSAFADSVVRGNQSIGVDAAIAGGFGAKYSTAPFGIDRSTISANRAIASAGQAVAGGFFSADLRLVVSSSTISGNAVEGPVGSGVVGGGLFAGSGTLVNTTVSGNSAGDGAGGIFLIGDPYGDAAVLSNSTITGNRAGTGAGVAIADGEVVLNSSIVFGNINTDPSVPPAYAMEADLDGDAGVTVAASSANNLVGSSGLTVPVDTITSDPLLGPLANNGGPTLTHALGAGSPAIDAGNNAMALAEDQRGTGFPRVVGTSADIGAVEMAEAAAPAAGEPIMVPVNSPWALGLLGTLLGFFGLRRGWFSTLPRGRQS